MILQDQMTIRANEQIAENIFEMVLEGRIVNEIVSPGQFVHVRVSDTYEPLLRRPISIASFDKEKQQMTLIFRAEGKGTQLLANKLIGMEVNVLGPLGNGFSADTSNAGETALLIGGGIGVPPLYQLSKELTAKGVHCIHVFGFQTASAVFYKEKFEALGETRIVTVDGTVGETGFVTDSLLRGPVEFDTYYTCGPTPMLQAVERTFPTHKGFCSFEQRMGCGIGACFACVYQTQEGQEQPYVKVCSDGPVFPAGVVAL